MKSEGEREMKNEVRLGTERPACKSRTSAKTIRLFYASPTLKKSYLICPLVPYSLVGPLDGIDTVRVPGLL